ncbi:D-alanine--D-alanine ligase family protein [Fastidiosipila sanguinis]|uniref:D-alanine--D-alanine ligase n=1 Tax=Fastidiosipila sanguinis TaxID=236753 RepID=A0A2S0KNR9_9FIRM|nr:D-alanine--D-alanine ligase family protein [Fastidiosipila sanguinis]AVM42680.1 D-alanine--D-alanine ligase A [Fastidiosipila sanguinis]
MKEINNVMVLFGGVSTEHAISCRSAHTIIKGLKAAGYNVIPVGITLEGEWLPFRLDLDKIREENWVELTKADLAQEEFPAISLKELSSPKAYLRYLCGGIDVDLVYLALHGINAEDGVIQGLLELCDIPYIGANLISSAISMDKAYTKLLIENSDIPQLDFVICHREDINNSIDSVIADVERLGYPVFLKPANGGSSVGTYKVNNAEELRQSLIEAAEFDHKVLAEPFYLAREVEIACLGNHKAKTAVAGEIVKSADVEYYDYKTKYISADGAKVQIPADIKAETMQKLQDYAKRIYSLLEINGLSRIDFFVSPDESEIYFNEINTLPGFTSISLFPVAWEKEGLELPQLLKEICELGLEAYEQQKRKIDV